MATVLVTYDLKQPGRNYQPVHDYLRRYTHCKQMESVWLLDTNAEPIAIRDALQGLVDQNDVVFVVRIKREWASVRYQCGGWLNDDARTW
jgi:CRISPR/Cas system-associated endoribonuclease Cas2